jgi:hypothetical protein
MGEQGRQSEGGGEREGTKGGGVRRKRGNALSSRRERGEIVVRITNKAPTK